MTGGEGGVGGRKSGDRPGEVPDRHRDARDVLRELVTRLAEGAVPGPLQADVLELGRRLGASPEADDRPGPGAAGEVGPC